VSGLHLLCSTVMFFPRATLRSSGLAYVQVGIIFSQSVAERNFILHTGEVLQVASMQVSDVVGVHRESRF
jgi:hypothetical protein